MIWLHKKLAKRFPRDVTTSNLAFVHVWNTRIGAQKKKKWIRFDFDMEPILDKINRTCYLQILLFYLPSFLIHSSQMVKIITHGREEKVKTPHKRQWK